MSRYASIDCPICRKALDSGDDIVVCPECGAPYHKRCYQQKKHCIFQDLHQKGEAWQAPNKEKQFDGNASLRCPRCDTVNPPYGIFCQVCGSKLNDKPVENPANSDLPPNARQTPFNKSIPRGIPFNPYTTPFGGVAPDEEIDDIPAKELAIFVGKNSHYYLPVFKELSKTKTKVINWGAFFFHGGYFLYRKMYGPAILILCIYLLLDIPNAIMALQSINSGYLMISAAQAATFSGLTTIALICNIISIAIRFFCGFLANSFYKKHCKKKIMREKQINRTKEEYYTALSQKGSVATKLVTGLLIGYMSLYLFGMYALILLGVI